MKRLTLLLKPAQRKTDNVIIEAGLLLRQFVSSIYPSLVKIWHHTYIILIRLLLIDYRGIE